MANKNNGGTRKKRGTANSIISDVLETANNVAETVTEVIENISENANGKRRRRSNQEAPQASATSSKRNVRTTKASISTEPKRQPAATRGNTKKANNKPAATQKGRAKAVITNVKRIVREAAPAPVVNTKPTSKLVIRSLTVSESKTATAISEFRKSMKRDNLPAAMQSVKTMKMFVEKMENTLVKEGERKGIRL